MLYFDIINTPIGDLLLLASDKGLKKILFEDQLKPFEISSTWEQSTEKLSEAKEQLLAYFNNQLIQFELQLDPDGTVFQKQIWKELEEIPFGETKSYQDIANSIEKPNACRAIGMANSKNPIPIIIPCHRVIGKNGKLTGYAGGLDIKAKLLQIEGIDLGNDSQQFELF
ncbi:methylated-DNA--[protein]-cysteine S-methyltransferase [Marinifilum sp. D714]|uniref:methylated-DNA--[protein]-cysteine S-methyltransferase n=1 Tax=Marinifilum sp. D714 TaxID=2937523 RepID=UPI0027C51009|nr:methylated-DNA--[protein]-cysteine S-methyltransferase [Marinifilum sp. D714]MDQ2178917.1 methylated-DNA--[protein]-cysteine S-methyltransferase [Marinifilum sp. D714]